MRLSGIGLAVVIAALTLGVGCGRRSQYRTLPRNVRESVHRDYPDCRGRDMRGADLGDGRYRVVACGLDVIYECSAGPHSRWRTCHLAGGAPGASVVYASGGEVPLAYQQPAPAAPTATAVVTVDPMAPPPQPAAPTPSAAAPTAPTPGGEQVELALRGWLDTQRATILGCTGTPAALVEVAWTADGVPTIALGGEMHGTPAEACVVRSLPRVQLQNAGGPGALRHVIQ
jgi:hypothetical protein